MKKLFICFLLIGLLACQPQSKNDDIHKDTVKQYPQRIVTLSPHLTELIFSLGLQDRLVATVEYSDFPDKAKLIPRIGNAFQLDWEALTALKPDMIIAWQGGNPEALLTKLERHKFKVLRLENAKLFDLPIQLEELSVALTGHSIPDLGDDYLKSLELLGKKFSSKKTIKVFYQISSEPIYTIDNKHTISEMLKVCGAENVFQKLGKTSAPVTPEAVVGAKPDVILTTTNTRDAVVSLWAGLIPAENILAVSADEVTRASLRMVEGTKNICESLDAWRLLTRY